MLVTNHVLSGALIGHATPTLPVSPGSPVSWGVPVSLAAGVLSHLVLDAVPHWGSQRPIENMLHVAVPDGLIGLTAMVVLTVTTHPERRARVLAGMTGAALLDLDKPGRLFFGASPFPGAVDRLHQRIQHESPSRMPQEILVGTTGMALTALLTRRRRPPAAI
jgi:hypothetical protein